jgi:hypothetical protein
MAVSNAVVDWVIEDRIDKGSRLEAGRLVFDVVSVKDRAMARINLCRAIENVTGTLTFDIRCCCGEDLAPGMPHVTTRQKRKFRKPAMEALRSLC